MRLLAVWLLLAFSFLPAPAQEKKSPKKKAPDRSLEYLKITLTAGELNRRDGLDNEAVEADLREMPQLPEIRNHCRRMFKVIEVRSTTIDALADWIAVREKRTLDQVMDLKLSEVLKVLDAHYRKQKK